MLRKNTKPDIRYLKQMDMTVYDKTWLKTAALDLELYYMHRGLEHKNGLRYDITVIPARMLGQEFVKTKGHINGCQELYIVLDGKAIFLLQKSDKKSIEDVYAVKAKKGDAVVVPLGFGHITINPYKQELKVANWMLENCQNVYDLFEKMNGACYFYTKSGWIKNKQYSKIPKLRFEEPLKSVPKNLDFLR